MAISIDISVNRHLHLQPMNYDDLINYYGSAEKAAAAPRLEYPNAVRTRQGIHRWKGREIPLDEQIAFEVETGGALKADLPDSVRASAA